MFRIELFCEDKRLAQVLIALEGLIHDNPRVNRVANAVATKRGVVAVTSGSLLEALTHAIKQAKVKEINKDFIRQVCKDAGRNESSAPYVIKQATQAKLLKTTGSGNKRRYVVT